MEIFGKIIGINYKVCFADELEIIDIKDFDINKAPSCCLISEQKSLFAISKWVSPKRTRSYPFERVYNTLNNAKKITVIPIIKDEGANGDRDFIQWDTVSLMSLLDVFVIFAYYTKAEKKNKKITNQQFDNKYIISKIEKIKQYHSSALHWNLNELNCNLQSLVAKTKSSYLNIEKSTGVKLHNFDGIDHFIKKIDDDISSFMIFSREKAVKAQLREISTIQPKESLSSFSKAKINITNYLGGEYFLTVDEVAVSKTKINLIEGKHSKNSLLPSKGDIKDGLLKMILYSNLCNVLINERKLKSEAVLSLTSSKINGKISSSSKKSDILTFFDKNHFSKSQITTIQTIFTEAIQNHFTILIHYSK